MRLAVGRIVSAHGVRGEVRIVPVDPEADLTGREVEAPGLGSFEVVRQRTHPRGRILALRGVSDRDAAERLIGVELAAESETAPALPDGRFYVHDLIGLTVYDESGQELGRITEVEEKPANDVWIARGPAGTYLIPAVHAAVLQIDLRDGRITVRGGGVLGPETAR